MPGEVLGQHHLSGPKAVEAAVLQPYLHPARYRDDGLAARGAMPIAEITRVEAVKHDTGGRLRRGQLRMAIQFQLFNSMGDWPSSPVYNLAMPMMTSLEIRKRRNSKNGNLMINPLQAATVALRRRISRVEFWSSIEPDHAGQNY